ncbi:DNA excision repair protein ERCC-1 isoform X1 [Tenebrio molitor]|uniref:DNA excision repair protein ERCC-1 isoform X1 n=1 Tax=Tenebrio molitor TaxID=7067 RepID=UPI0036248F19
MLDESLDNVAAEFASEFAPEECKKSNENEEINPQTSKGSKTHCLLVSPKQRGNPLLKSVCNVPWEYDDIVPDYQMGKTSCALFLSLRYHNLNPDYIHQRLKLLGKTYELRVLLVQVDISDPYHVLKNLTRICILADLTLVLAWSPEEAGKIIETYKIYENKPAEDIMERGESSPYIRLLQVLTSIRPVNKTDAMNLIARFKTLEGIIQASEYQLSECPGLGPVKAKKLYTTLHEQFCRS